MPASVTLYDTLCVRSVIVNSVTESFKQSYTVLPRRRTDTSNKSEFVVLIPIPYEMNEHSLDRSASLDVAQLMSCEPSTVCYLFWYGGDSPACGRRHHSSVARG